MHFQKGISLEAIRFDKKYSRLRESFNVGMRFDRYCISIYLRSLVVSHELGRNRGSYV